MSLHIIFKPVVKKLLKETLSHYNLFSITNYFFKYGKTQASEEYIERYVDYELIIYVLNLYFF
jgi:hypothetical protein